MSSMSVTEDPSPRATKDFETGQTVLAAYLVYEGHDIKATSWERNMCTFYFENTEMVQADFGRFLTGEARVEPSQFNRAFGEVLARVKREKNQTA